MNNLFSHTTTTDTKKTNFNRHFLFALVISLGFSACKKEYIEVGADQTGTPVFETTFNLDGAAQEFIAGDDDYYMHTAYQQDADEVMVYSGNFALETCTQDACTNSIQFELRSTQLASKTDPATDMRVMGYQFKDDTAPIMDVYQVAFEGFYEEENLAQVEFDFDDGFQVKGETSVIHNFLDDPSETYLPRFNVRSTQGHFTSLAKRLYFDEATYCSADFDVVQNTDGTVQFEGIAEGLTNPFFYLWTYGMGGGFDSNLTPDLDSLTVLEYTLGINFEDNCYSEITRTFSRTNTNNLSYSNSDYTAEVLDKYTGGSRLGLSTFTVQYIDDNGTIYRSDWGEQGTDSYFEIIAIEDYQNNTNNQATKKLTIEYDCQVFDADGNYLNIENGIGTIAVAHPN